MVDKQEGSKGHNKAVAGGQGGQTGSIYDRIINTPGLTGIIAKAGHGKSTFARGIIRAARRAGRRVVILDKMAAFRQPSFTNDPGIKIRRSLVELERWYQEPRGTVWIMDEIDCRIRDRKPKDSKALTPYQIWDEMVQQCRQVGHIVVWTARRTTKVPLDALANAKWRCWGRIVLTEELDYISRRGLPDAHKLLPGLPRGQWYCQEVDKDA